VRAGRSVPPGLWLQTATDLGLVAVCWPGTDKQRRPPPRRRSGRGRRANAGRGLVRFSLLSPLSPGYIGEFEVVDDHRSGKIVVELVGRVNKAGVISPRFDISLNQIEKWCNMLLPSRQFGRLMLTTSYGIIDHEHAKKIHTGGKILGFFY
jgi:hypothetical protein